MKPLRNQKGVAMIVEIVIAAVVLLVGFAAVKHYLRAKQLRQNSSQTSNQSASSGDPVSVGKVLSSNQCSGSGAGTLSVSPMKAADFAYIEPYGVMVGGHVTPVDHQYYAPTVFNSPKDTYEVRAMADAKIVSIENHPTRIRLIFSVSCTFFYYYDLVTSIEPSITNGANVKAGQLIGHIGGQTLDFAVWDTTKPLKGFINPDSYKSEPWKIYTADPLNYETSDLKQLSLSKYLRTAEPRSGKIDYDVDGKLIGTWFQQNTNGYDGLNHHMPGYWVGHLSIVPDHLDPATMMMSIGYLAPTDGSQTPNQFALEPTAPNPVTVSQSNGLVKYNLLPWHYVTSSGAFWTGGTFTTGIKVSANQPPAGCALAQLTGQRQLKFETIMGSSCSSVAGFKSPKIYER